MSSRNLSWLEMTQKAWGKDWTAPEVAYEFGNRKFNEPRSRPPVIETPGPPGLSQYADNYADSYA